MWPPFRAGKSLLAIAPLAASQCSGLLALLEIPLRRAVERIRAELVGNPGEKVWGDLTAGRAKDLVAELERLSANAERIRISD